MQTQTASTKNFPGWLLWPLLVGCILLGIAWKWLAHQADQIAADLTAARTLHKNAQDVAISVKKNPPLESVSLAGRENNLAALTPEQRRRVVTLGVINDLKKKHEIFPPPPRKNPPPSGPDGIFFPELASDVEYSRLYLTFIRSRFSIFEKRKLQELGVPPDKIERTIDLLAEAEMASIDFHQLSKGEGKAVFSGKNYQSLTALREEFDQEICTLLGEEKFTQFKNFDQRTSMADRYLFTNLAARLSYSNSPLTAKHIGELISLIEAKAEPSKQVVQTLPNGSQKTTITRFDPYTYSQSKEFIEVARSILNPEQIAAMQELWTEKDAAWRRSKLPKSSELPRNAAPAATSKK